MGSRSGRATEEEKTMIIPSWAMQAEVANRRERALNHVPLYAVGAVRESRRTARRAGRRAADTSC